MTAAVKVGKIFGALHGELNNSFRKEDSGLYADGMDKNLPFF